MVDEMLGIADLDDAYANAAHIPQAEAFPARWRGAAHEWRMARAAAGRARLNLPYGPGERQRFDLFLPEGEAQGLVMFVHGGYWRAFGREDWSHLAAGAVASGYAVAIPSYTLAPAARISAITREIAAALEAVAGEVPGPIHLAGHSAGGHLVARMLCRDVRLSRDVVGRLARAVAISPLGDLRPLLRTRINEDLGLTPAEAEAESPLLRRSRRPVPLHVWVGEEERPAFLDQASALAQGWNAPLTIAPKRHHFNVIDDLCDPESPLMQALLGG